MAGDDIEKLLLGKNKCGRANQEVYRKERIRRLEIEAPRRDASSRRRGILFTMVNSRLPHRG